MTLRELIETAVSGLKKEYLSPGEQAKITNYILDNSTLAVTTKSIAVESASILGIGSDTANKPIPDFKLVTFFWGDLNPEEQSVDGLPTREWFLLSHRTLEQLERVILARGQNEEESNFATGEMIVLINGKLQEYNVQSEPLTTKEGGLAREYVGWVGIEPYQITFKDSNEGKEILTETYPSQYQTQLRVLQLLRDKAESIHVNETLTDRELHFSVTQNVYDTRPIAGDTDLNIMWHLWEVLDFVD